MEQPSTSTNSPWPFPFPQQDWEQTPPSVQAYLLTVQQSLTQVQARVEALEARLQQNSTTSHRPPSSDNPYKKPRQRSTSATSRKAGGQPGHAGHRQVLLPPTAVHDLRPERCPCGNTTFAATRPYYTHQVLELPPIEVEVRHFVLHQGWCTVCGSANNAQIPPEHG
jgi:transposase